MMQMIVPIFVSMENAWTIDKTIIITALRDAVTSFNCFCYLDAQLVFITEHRRQSERSLFDR
jgi:hypothetical protein